MHRCHKEKGMDDKKRRYPWSENRRFRFLMKGISLGLSSKDDFRNFYFFEQLYDQGKYNGVQKREKQCKYKVVNPDVCFEKRIDGRKDTSGDRVAKG